MKTISFPFSVRIAAVLASVLLAACGGGGGVDVAGVGSGGSGVASGTVTGFGSVIVDGVEYDDADASRDAADADGRQVNVAVKLGQRVRLTYAGANVARHVEVQAQLVGPVLVAPAGEGSFAVMGQQVRIVTSAADVTRSGPTVLDGYATAADIHAGDDVEVHGAWVYDSALEAHVLVATRVEKRAGLPDPVQLGGVVTAIDGSTLRLNSATGTQIRTASPPAVAVGDVVSVWVARAALAGSPLPALRVAEQGVGADDVAANASVSVSGLASRYDRVARTLEVQGVRVRLADGLVADEAALAAGEFVTVKLGRVGTSLVATAIGQRSGSIDLGRTVQLKGVTRGVDWHAATVGFRLRGASIQAAAAAIDASCRAAGTTTDVFVEVSGSVPAAGGVLSATAVKCSEAVPDAATAEYTGSITAIDPTARTLSLLVGASGRSVTARWDERTYFEQPPASLPVGLRVEVEGVMDKGSNMLRLSTVEASD